MSRYSYSGANLQTVRAVTGSLNTSNAGLFPERGIHLRTAGFWNIPGPVQLSGYHLKGSRLTRIAYLAHDLTDPAVRRRLSMLGAGGATLTVAGLSRGATTHTDALVLGQSADGRLAHRALQVGTIAASHRRRILAHLGEPDVLIARNLEMLCVAVSLLSGFPKRPRLVYECLDIHRLLTESGGAGLVLRRLEKQLARHVDLVLTSSPAFVTNHLGAVYGDRILLVENRVLELEADERRPVNLQAQAGPPWVIGWFGALRCQKSLDILSEAARIAKGQIEIIIRGRPSPAIFDDISAMVRDRPHVRFEGPYDPRELDRHYKQAHFAWGVDLYEAGANSEWLLPNRLYESVHHGCVPIGRFNTETGRFLVRHGIGIALKEVSSTALVNTINALQPDDYTALLHRQNLLPRCLTMADRTDCSDLVAALNGTLRPFAQMLTP